MTSAHRNDLHDPGRFPHRLTHQPPLRFSALPRPTHGRWAACEVRSPDSRLERFLQPSRHPDVGHQWRTWRKLAAYSCGGSPGIDACAPHRVPIFTIRAVARMEPSHRQFSMRCSIESMWICGQSISPLVRRAQIWPRPCPLLQNQGGGTVVR